MGQAASNILLSDDGSYDWFKSYSELKPLIRSLIPDQNARILVLGCGNSTLSDDVSWSHESLKVL